MSELQLGLIAIGAIVVIGVYAFNWLQERQFRRRIESRFSERPADVLLEAERATADTEERIEPTFGEAAHGEPEGQTAEHAGVAAAGAGDDAAHVTRPSRAAAARASASASDRNVDALQIDYVCDIQAAEPLEHAALSEFLKAVAAVGKPVSVIGCGPHGSEWVALPCGTDVLISRVQASLQLADRSGPVNRVQLSSMRDLARQFANSVGASCECPDIDQAAHAAADIDRFCAQVDVSIGCNVLPRKGAGLLGTKLRGLLESAGFGLEAAGQFVLRAEDGAVLMTVQAIDGEALTPERLRSATLPGLTLTMDVPKVPAGGRVFDRMIELGRHLAHSLDASMVDDNRAPLTEAGINVIRLQLRNVQSVMDKHGVPAGGTLAARLFS